MNISILIFYIGLIAFSQVMCQILRHVVRFRNFTIESETGSTYLIAMNIFQDKYEHKLEFAVNVTKDFITKNIEVVVNRCRFEKYDCEYFQRWKFDGKLKDIVYMKNQIWSPAVENITPKVDLPIVKKNIYHLKSGTIDPIAALTFYPEAVNYFWRADAILNDYNNKKAAILKFDISIFSYVEKKKNRNRGANLKPL